MASWILVNIGSGEATGHYLIIEMCVCARACVCVCVRACVCFSYRGISPHASIHTRPAVCIVRFITSIHPKGLYLH